MNHSGGRLTNLGFSFKGNDAPWSDLPTLDDALISGWDDLCTCHLPSPPLLCTRL